MTPSRTWRPHCRASSTKPTTASGSIPHSDRSPPLKFKRNTHQIRSLTLFTCGSRGVETLNGEDAEAGRAGHRQYQHQAPPACVVRVVWCLLFCGCYWAYALYAGLILGSRSARLDLRHYLDVANWRHAAPGSLDHRRISRTDTQRGQTTAILYRCEIQYSGRRTADRESPQGGRGDDAAQARGAVDRIFCWRATAACCS